MEAWACHGSRPSYGGEDGPQTLTEGTSHNEIGTEPAGRGVHSGHADVARIEAGAHRRRR